MAEFMEAIEIIEKEGLEDHDAIEVRLNELCDTYDDIVVFWENDDWDAAECLLRTIKHRYVTDYDIGNMILNDGTFTVVALKIKEIQ